tara:strand:+ start:1673 stop:2068 length:396 start_codon:yes stop_codon:yes gene_type:complete
MSNFLCSSCGAPNENLVSSCSFCGANTLKEEDEYSDSEILKLANSYFGRYKSESRKSSGSHIKSKTMKFLEMYLSILRVRGANNPVLYQESLRIEKLMDNEEKFASKSIYLTLVIFIIFAGFIAAIVIFGP